ncbi:DUF3857 domain-containing protein [candidate division KSB1 bacterium]|nr:MAG: DUF3857 domain-containing protein [candidate division KSB1 bacterium]
MKNVILFNSRIATRNGLGAIIRRGADLYSKIEKHATAEPRVSASVSSRQTRRNNNPVKGVIVAKNRIVGFLFLLTCILFVCVADGRAWMEFKQEDLTLQPPPWCADADAMLLDKYYNTASNITSVRIKIFTENGRKYGDLWVPATPENVHARTITPDGRTIEVKSSHIEKLQEKARGRRVDGTFGSRIAFPEVTAGCILECYYKPWRWFKSGWYRSDFDYYDFPIRHSIVTFTSLKSEEYEFIPVNLDKYDYAYEMKDESLPLGKGTRWNGVISEFRINPAEKYLPPDDYYKPHVYFLKKCEKFTLGKTELNQGWSTAVDWMELYLAEFQQSGGKLKPLSRRLTAGETDSLAIARNLYCWVCDSLESIDDRYCFHFGFDDEGDPIKMMDRVKTLKATGAEKALILQALYDLAGVPSRILLSVPINKGLPIAAMPVLGQFSEMILELPVNGKTYYLDPVEKNTPFGMIPWYFRGTMALPIAKGVDTIMTVPLTRKPNICDYQLRCTLSETGDLSAAGTLSLSEEYRLNYFNDLLNADDAERKKILTGTFLRAVDESQISRVEVRMDSVRPSLFFVDVEFAIPDYAAVLADEILLRPDCAMRFPMDMLPPCPERKNDLYFDFPRSRVFNISYEIPAGFEFAGEAISLHEGGTAGLNYFAAINNDAESGRLVYQRSDTREHSFYSASSYAELRDYYNTLAKHDALEIVLKRKP